MGFAVLHSDLGNHRESAGAWRKGRFWPRCTTVVQGVIADMSNMMSLRNRLTVVLIDFNGLNPLTMRRKSSTTMALKSTTMSLLSP